MEHRTSAPATCGMSAIALLLATAVLAACSDATGPTIPDVDGAWTYSISNLTAPGLEGSCVVADVRLNITQNEQSFTGSTNGGRLNCTDGTVVNAASFSIVNGTVSTDGSISFNFGTSDWSHTGNVNGGSMTGMTELRGEGVTFSGDFTAVR